MSRGTLTLHIQSCVLEVLEAITLLRLRSRCLFLISTTRTLVMGFFALNLFYSYREAFDNK